MFATNSDPSLFTKVRYTDIAGIIWFL